MTRRTKAKVVDLFEALKRSLEPAAYIPAPGDIVAIYRPSLDGVVTGPHKRVVTKVKWPRVCFVGHSPVRVGPSVTIQLWGASHDAELDAIRSGAK